MRRALPLLLVLLVLGQPVASAAEVLGSLEWDGRELPQWVAVGSNNLVADPAFRNVGTQWSISFTDVGGGFAEVRNETLTLVVPKATKSGAAYADTLLPVEPGQAYHVGFAARLGGEASEVAVLLLPVGEGNELVVRGEPRANHWGMGGEWTAPEGVTQARLVLRFILEAGHGGSVEFRNPHVGQGFLPPLAIDGATPTASRLLSAGTHTLSSEGMSVNATIETLPPQIRFDGSRFVTPGTTATFLANATDPDPPELVPNVAFDPFRSWWSAMANQDPQPTLTLSRHNAKVGVPAGDARTVTVGLPIYNPPGDGWLVQLDGQIPKEFSGTLIVRERGFSNASGFPQDYRDASFPIQGAGPWTFTTTRGFADSDLLEVILSFEIPAKKKGTITLRSASVTPLPDVLTPGDVTIVAKTRGLFELPGSARDVLGAETNATWGYWAGSAPAVCAGEPARVAWLPPADPGFAWVRDSTSIGVDAQPVLERQGAAVRLVREGETWWEAPADAPPAELPELTVARGSRSTFEVPCASTLPPGGSGIRTSGSAGLLELEISWWRTATATELVDDAGRPLARVVVTEPAANAHVLLATLAAIAAFGYAWRRPR